MCPGAAVTDFAELSLQPATPQKEAPGSKVDAFGVRPRCRATSTRVRQSGHGIDVRCKRDGVFYRCVGNNHSTIAAWRMRAVDRKQANVRRLQTATPILSDRVAKGELKVAGAYYDLPTGKVIPVWVKFAPGRYAANQSAVRSSL